MRGIVLGALLALFAVNAAARAEAAAQWVTLGTGGGPVVQVERARPANALVVNGATYLFDVGDGVQRQLAAAKLPLRSVKAVFVSHHHVDHNGDLGVLLVTRWLLDRGPVLPVFGPPGTAAMVAGLAAANVPVEDAPVTVGGGAMPSIASTVRARDLAPVLAAPTLVFEDENIRVTAISVDHFHVPADTPEARMPRSYAYRVEAGGRSLVYTGDTGPSIHLVRLAMGADLLVTEVIDLAATRAMLLKVGTPPGHVEPLMAHMEQDHLTPEWVGRIAAEAGVRQVVLTHFVPGLDGETAAGGYVEGIAPAFKGPVKLARDLDRF